MSLAAGTTLAVYIDGVEITRTTQFSLNQQPDIEERWSVGAYGPTRELNTWFPFSGSFICESDAADALQVSLMAAADTATIILYEHSGSSRNLGSCIVWGAGHTSDRAAIPTRSFGFERAGV